MVHRLILILILCCSCTKMEVATNTLLIADWSQTRQVAENPVDYYEHNIFLDYHPDKSDVDNYFMGAIAINTLLHRYLPKKYLPYYQTGLIAVEVGAIANNYQVGLQVKF